jgi:PHD/YefM family antitoxin component YafN of YafNO toxin-antitoxin module
MRDIKVNDLGESLKNMVLNPDPVDEDIIIKSESGDPVGVIISPKAYEFFLNAVEEEEDRLDSESVEEFHREKE